MRLLGTALWARDASRLSALAGALYAGPDPQTKQVFERNYAARYDSPPRDLASIAFDAAGAARAVSGPAGVNANALLNPNGFSGADGVFVLLPDGRVRRALALFEIGASESACASRAAGASSARASCDRRLTLLELLGLLALTVAAWLAGFLSVSAEQPGRCSGRPRQRARSIPSICSALPRRAARVRAGDP